MVVDRVKNNNQPQDGGNRSPAGKVVLIDGYSLVFRAFFALPPLHSPEGEPTNAVYGFLNMLLKLLEEENPTHVVVAFDAPGPTFRDELFEAYKAHRPAVPDELRSQFPLVRQALEALSIRVVEQPGYEADDIIGTLAKRARNDGFQVLIVTGDKDVLQVVEPGISALITRRGITNLVAYDEDSIREEFGISPQQLIDVKALMGDASDNIPGVPGIGEKTALKLIQQFGSVENVLNNLEQVGGKKLPQLLKEHTQAALDSKRLATIAVDVPLDVEWDVFRRGDPVPDQVREVFTRLGFRSLLDRLGVRRADMATSTSDRHVDMVSITDETALNNLLAYLNDFSGTIGISYRLAGEDQRFCPVVYICLASGDQSWVIYGREATGRDGDQLAEVDLLRVFDAALQAALAGRVRLVVHDLKPLLRRCFRTSLWKKCPPVFAGDVDSSDQLPVFDTAVAAYLLDPTRTTFNISDLARQYLSTDAPNPEDLRQPGKGRRRSHGPWLAGVDVQQFLQSAVRQSHVLIELAGVLAAELAAMDMDYLFRQVEAPLTEVLAVMEHVGVAVDRAALEAMGHEFAARIQELTSEIHELAGMEFNVNSPQQLGQVLFEKLKLPVIKKNKTGYSTDAEVLEQLRDEHPIAGKILEHRSLVKLMSTYVEGLAQEIESDGRIHTTFQQTVAATGRLASTSPNLQNIPIRDPRGRGLRKAFIAGDGHVLLALDYSQIELRVLAHLSGDELMIEAFQRGDDIHRRTAAEVFGVDLEDVTPDMREFAKAVNFGLVYGQTDFGLARQLGISRAEARKFIDRYFDRYTGVRRYLQEAVKQARANGYVRTMLGRIRYLPDINSRIFHRRSFAERTAMNTPVQGTAADIIKAAMVRVYRRLTREGRRSRLVLQIHDELILEVPVEELDEVAALVMEEMTGAAQLKVPLVVEAKAGPNWYDMERLNVTCA